MTGSSADRDFPLPAISTAASGINDVSSVLVAASSQYITTSHSRCCSHFYPYKAGHLILLDSFEASSLVLQLFYAANTSAELTSFTTHA